jgi:hypothetical protein
MKQILGFRLVTLRRPLCDDSLRGARCQAGILCSPINRVSNASGNVQGRRLAPMAPKAAGRVPKRQVQSVLRELPGHSSKGRASTNEGPS